MNENELISLLNILIKAPSLIKKIDEDSLDTEFGTIKQSCLGNCVDIILHNGVQTSITITDNKSVIDNLFDEIRETSESFVIYILKNRLKACYDTLSNNSDNN